MADLLYELIDFLYALPHSCNIRVPHFVAHTHTSYIFSPLWTGHVLPARFDDRINQDEP